MPQLIREVEMEEERTKAIGIQVDAAPKTNPIRLRRRTVVVSKRTVLKHIDLIKDCFSDKFWTLIKGHLENRKRKSANGRRYSKKYKNICCEFFLKSQQFYKMLREMSDCPTKATLRNYMFDLFSDAGATSCMDRTLRRIAATKTETSKLCILSFDETDIASSL